MTKMNPEEYKRMQKAKEILNAGIPIIRDKKNPRRFHIKNYLIQWNRDGTWSCSCPDFIFHRVVCKHIYAVATKVIKNVRKIPYIKAGDQPTEIPKELFIPTPRVLNSKKLFEEIIKNLSDRVSIVNRKTILVKGQLTDYKIELKGKRFFVSDAKNEAQDYCVLFKSYKYPKYDLLISLILFLLNDIQNVHQIGHNEPLLKILAERNAYK